MEQVGLNNEFYISNWYTQPKKIIRELFNATVNLDALLLNLCDEQFTKMVHKLKPVNNISTRVQSVKVNKMALQYH